MGKRAASEIKLHDMKCELVPIDSVKPWEDNPKKHDIPLIIRSFRRFGITKPIEVLRSNKRIVCGHGRYAAFKKLGMDKIPIKYVDMPVKEAEAYALVDNRSGEVGGWDKVRLKDVLGSIRDAALPDLDLTEFGFEQFMPMSAEEDEVPPVPKKTDIKRGDLFQLGRHRLLCGDATSKENMDRLMDGKTADMVFTDPPYGVDYGAKNRFLNSFQPAGRNLNDIANDALSKDDLFKMLNAAFLNVHRLAADDCSVYVTAPQGGELGLMMMMMMMMMMMSNLPVRHVLIWKKNTPNFSLGRLDYEYQHEPILYTWKKTHKFYGGSERSVWEIDKPRHADLHPTMKPVELVARAIKNSSQKDEIVLDPFGGSGTTLIAAEQLGRTCLMLEIEPLYVEVIIKRWEALTNQKAVKLCPPAAK